MSKDLYGILGVSKSATNDEIKKAYRKKAKEFHPDVNPEATDDMFKDISEANEILSDEKTRSQYDKYGYDGIKGGNKQPDFDSMYEHFMNSAGFNPFSRKRTPIGDDIHVKINLTLEEINTGVTKKFTYKRFDSCNKCSGHGGIGKNECKKCNGAGEIIHKTQTQFGYHVTNATCDECYGVGSTYTESCVECNSTGLKQVDEHISVDIPHGTSDKMGISMNGKGNSIKGGVAGILRISIFETPHEKYLRNGNNLKMQLKLPYHALILGDKIDIECIDGSKIRITIKELSQVGDILKITGKGLKEFNSERVGDMFIHLDIEIPKVLSDDEKNIILELKKLNEKVG